MLLHSDPRCVICQRFSGNNRQWFIKQMVFIYTFFLTLVSMDKLFQECLKSLRLLLFLRSKNTFVRCGDMLQFPSRKLNYIRPPQRS